MKTKILVMAVSWLLKAAMEYFENNPDVFTEIGDKALDMAEDAAAQTDTPIDDMVVAAIRNISGIPDND